MVVLPFLRSPESRNRQLSHWKRQRFGDFRPTPEPGFHASAQAGEAV